MTTYAKAVERLVRREDLEVGSGAGEDEIVSAEQNLLLSIQGAYRDFLRQFGWCSIGHFELYGLGANIPPHLDLLRITSSERDETQPSLRSYLLPLMNDGGGNLYCLDTRIAPEPSVVFWAHDRSADQVHETEAEDFASWLTSLLDELDEQ